MSIMLAMVVAETKAGLSVGGCGKVVHEKSITTTVWEFDGEAIAKTFARKLEMELVSRGFSSYGGILVLGFQQICVVVQGLKVTVTVTM